MRSNPQRDPQSSNFLSCAEESNAMRKILIMGLPGAGKTTSQPRSRRSSMQLCSTPTLCAQISRAISASPTRIASSTHAAWDGCVTGWSKRAVPWSPISSARPRRRVPHSAKPSRFGSTVSSRVPSKIPTGCLLRPNASIFAFAPKARHNTGPSRRWLGSVRRSTHRSRRLCSSDAINRANKA